MIKRFLAKYTAVIRLTWIQALEYKANSLVGTFAIVSGVFIEYLLWKRIFLTRGISEINGFTFEDLMVYIFLSLVVGQLKSSWVTSLEMITAIREGELNKYLIRPISFFTYHFMLFIGYNSLFYLVYFFMIAGMVIFFPAWAFPSFLNIIGFLGTLIISIYLSYTVYFVMVCFAFWFGEVRALIIAYNLANMVLSGQMVPLRFFPESVLKVLQYTPLPYLVDLPVSIATGNLPIDQWGTKTLQSLFWSVAMTFLGLIVYRRGIQKYEGFGG
ncbi:MAG: hypothetical protein GXO91_06885 [FCB group bacterium]|nr:hypothetical protein [FCB group bacterium]